MLVANHVVASIGLGISSARATEILGKQARGSGLHLRGIVERPQRVVQSQQELMPAFAVTELFLDAGALADSPQALCRDFDQGNLIARPGAWRGTLHRKRRNPAAVLDQRGADESADLIRPQSRALAGCEARIG